MIPVDILITALIVAVAVAWAGRGIWRQFRRRMRGAASASACGGAQASCGNCPAGEDAVRPKDLSSCGDDRSEES
jgi:hypothetical protein